MFLEELRQVAARNVVGIAKPQADEVVIGPLAVELRAMAHAGELPEREAAMRAWDAKLRELFVSPAP